MADQLPTSTSISYNKRDEESLQSEEEKRKKRIKWAIYIAAFAVFQTIVILVFALVIMRVQTPKFRIGEIRTYKLETSTQPSSPSFNMSFVAPMRVKNTNFGPYKYEATTVYFTYGGVEVGRATTLDGQASMKASDRFELNLDLNYSALSGSSSLGNELSSGVLTLSSHAKMNGKVELMFIFRRKKIAEMNCTTTVDVSSKVVRSLSCI